MAKFDESKIINCLHTDKAEIGKKYYFGEGLLGLKDHVEYDQTCYTGTLIRVDNDGCPFQMEDSRYWKFLYPYEEPPKKRMTNRQLSEWLAKGNGQLTSARWNVIYASYDYNQPYDDDVPEDIIIRSWDSDEWIEPTVDIYERDCK